MNNNEIEKVDLALSNEEFYKRYGRKKTVGTYTLGCKVNQYETEAVTEIFENAGYLTVNFDEKADVYAINTCTVTGLSARKSRQIIRRTKSINNDAVVAVIGCYSQTAPDEVGNMPDVDIVMGTKERGKILEYIDEFIKNRIRINAVSNIMNAGKFEDLKIDRYKGRTRAFMKIQEGCSQFCTYCIIPYARGPVRSRPSKDVLAEVEKLAANGFKEVVLTGIHIASYGKGLKDMPLLDLIKKIHEVDGIIRIRLGSVEPSTVTKEFVVAARNLKKLCPHYHVSLQSGCDETLKRMNRRYTTAEYKKVIDLLRNNISDVAITTDVMVGFPGETEEEFKKTYKFLEEIDFTQIHVFKYSPRKGTPAASFDKQVDADIKEYRSNMVLKLSIQNTIKFNEKYVGKTLPVLFEQNVKSMEGFVEGLTANYIRVICKGNDKLKGSILDISIVRAESDYIIGEASNIL